MTWTSPPLAVSPLSPIGGEGWGEGTPGYQVTPHPTLPPGRGEGFS